MWTLAQFYPVQSVSGVALGSEVKSGLLPDPNMSPVLGGGVVRDHGWPHCPM